MPFRKRGGNPDDNRGGTELGSTSKRGFAIGDKAYNKAYSWSAGIFTVPIIFFCLFTQKFVIDQEDLTTLATIMLALSQLALAVFTFLKDTEQKSRYEFQLFTIATSGTLSTFLGILSFFYTKSGETHEYPITVTFIFGIAWAIAINFKSIKELLFKKIFFEKVPFSSIGFSIFGFTVILMLISSLLGHGVPILVAFVVLSLYSFILLFILLFSILLQLLVQTPGESDISMDLITKKAIENILLNNPRNAYTENELIDALRNHAVFRGKPNLVSRSRVTQDLVYQMDLEQLDSMPQLTIVDRTTKVIPRWQEEYSLRLKMSNPVIWIGWGILDNDYSELKDVVTNAKIYSLLADYSVLSEELLEDNNSVKKKYTVLSGKFKAVELGRDIERKYIHYTVFMDQLEYPEWRELHDLRTLLNRLRKWKSLMEGIVFDQLAGYTNKNSFLKEVILLDILFRILKSESMVRQLHDIRSMTSDRAHELIQQNCHITLNEFGYLEEFALNRIIDFCDPEM